MQTYNNITLVLLAAGLSRRFGPDDKLLALVNNVPLVCTSALSLPLASFPHKLAICSSSEVAEHLKPLGFSITLNPTPETGMGGSLACAVENLRTPYALICLADMPRISSAHIHVLMRAHHINPKVNYATTSDDYLGPPALFSTDSLRLLNFEGDKGARVLIKAAHHISVEKSLIVDVDHPADMDAL